MRVTSKVVVQQGVVGAEEVVGLVGVSCAVLSGDDWAGLHVGRDQGCVVP